MSNSGGDILFVVPTDEMGGAEQLIKLLASQFRRNGRCVNVICLSKATKLNGWADYDGPVKYINTSSVWFGLFRLSRLMLKKRYELVFSSQVYINGLLGFLRNLNIYQADHLVLRESTSVFLRYKGIKLWTFKMAYKIGYSGADLIICQTELMKNQLVDNLRFLSEHNLFVMDNPIDVDIVRKKAADIKKAEIDYGEYIVGLGRLIHAKGFDNLIRAFAALAGDFPSLKLLILGEGKERGPLEDLIKDYNLTESVFLPGYVHNPYPYLKAAKLCVVSSRIEGFPNTLLQMMTLNDSIVSTKCAGGVENIEGIYLSHNNDVNELILAIKNALADCHLSPFSRAKFDNYLALRSVQNYLSILFNRLEIVKMKECKKN